MLFSVRAVGAVIVTAAFLLKDGRAAGRGPRVGPVMAAEGCSFRPGGLGEECWGALGALMLTGIVGRNSGVVVVWVDKARRVYFYEVDLTGNEEAQNSDPQQRFHKHTSEIFSSVQCNSSKFRASRT